MRFERLHLGVLVDGLINKLRRVGVFSASQPLQAPEKENR